MQLLWLILLEDRLTTNLCVRFRITDISVLTVAGFDMKLLKMEDAVFVVVLAAAPSTVVFLLSSQCAEVSVSMGLSELSMPLIPGDTVRVALVRNGNIVVEVWPKNFTFRETTTTYNYNAFVAMSQVA